MYRKLVLSSATAFLIALTGCASIYNDGTKASEAGNWPLAEKLLIQAIHEGDNVPGAWNNLGVVYQRTGRLPQAIQAYTIAARYGDSVAQQNLVALGKPVPPTDLARPGASNMSNAEAILLLTGAAAQGYTQGRANAPPVAPLPQLPAAQPTIRCTSTTIGNQTSTVCK